MRSFLRVFLVCIGLFAFLSSSVDIYRVWFAGSMHAQAAQAVDEEGEFPSLSTVPIEDRPDMILIVSVPGLSFQEMAPLLLKQLPNLKRLAESGWIAALNIRTPEKGIEDVYLSINAGAPAIVPSGIQAYQVMDEADTVAGGDFRMADRKDIPLSEESRLTSSEDADVAPSDTLNRLELMGDNGPGVRERYERFTGHDASAGEIVVPELGYLVRINESQTYGAQIGKLGDALNEHGVRLAVFGHRIDGEGIRKDAPLMLMNSAGKLPGRIIADGWLLHDPSSPYGYGTDTERLLHGVIEFAEDHGSEPASPAAILIEYGDWYSLDQERRHYTSEQWEVARWRELRKLDELLGQLAALVDTKQHAQLWIMSPQPHTAAARAKLHVTPFIMYEHRSDHRAGGPGLLTSPTTKRPGLISLHDLGPTLLAASGITEAEGWLGFEVERTNRPDALLWLLNDVKKMQNVYELRTNVVAIFVTYEVLVLLLGLLMVLLRWHKQLRWMRLPLFSVLVAPLVILLLGLIPAYQPIIQATVLIIVVLLISLCCFMLPNWFSIFLIAAVNVTVLMADGLMGSNLLKYSIMGYDPMIGARYYGIGNEYMGVLVGSAILAMALFIQEARATGMKTRVEMRDGVVLRGMERRGDLMDRINEETQPGDKQGQVQADSLTPSAITLPPRQNRHPRGVRLGRINPQMMAAVCGTVLLVITFYMAAPNGGTNAGGALTACAAFGVAWLNIYGRERLRRMRILRLLWIVAALLIVGLLLLWTVNQWLNWNGASGKSHIGRAMDLLSAGRLDLIAGMIVRKLQMNLNLIRVSAWGKVLLTGIFVLAVLLLKPRGVLRTWQETRPVWMGGFTAIIIGSIVALALNDSGIVAAGTMIVYAAAPILLLVSEEVQAYGTKRH